MTLRSEEKVGECAAGTEALLCVESSSPSCPACDPCVTASAPPLLLPSVPPSHQKLQSGGGEYHRAQAVDTVHID